MAIMRIHSFKKGRGYRTEAIAPLLRTAGTNYAGSKFKRESPAECQPRAQGGHGNSLLNVLSLTTPPETYDVILLTKMCISLDARVGVGRSGLWASCRQIFKYIAS